MPTLKKRSLSQPLRFRYKYKLFNSKGRRSSMYHFTLNDVILLIKKRVSQTLRLLGINELFIFDY